MKLQLSEKDRKTLFIFLSLVVIACTFFFVYLPNTNKADSIDKETEDLEVQLQMYQNQELQVKELQNEIKRFDEENKKVLLKFPNFLTEERAIRVIRDMELDSNIDVDSVDFSSLLQFYTSAGSEGTPMSESGLEPGSTEDAGNSALNGYKMSLNLTFVAKYEDVKKMIKFINDYEESMSIESMSLSYDNSTGDLSGTMDISMYCVPNGGTDYKIPDFGDIPIGVNNVFGKLSSDAKYVSPLPSVNTEDTKETETNDTDDKKSKNSNSKK